MEALVHAMLSNALAAAGLALIPAVLTRAGRSPALVHSLWLLVLLKLVTPPLVTLPFELPLPRQHPPVRSSAGVTEPEQVAASAEWGRRNRNNAGIGGQPIVRRFRARTQGYCWSRGSGFRLRARPFAP